MRLDETIAAELRGSGRRRRHPCDPLTDQRQPFPVHDGAAKFRHQHAGFDRLQPADENRLVGFARLDDEQEDEDAAGGLGAPRRIGDGAFALGRVVDDGEEFPAVAGFPAQAFRDQVLPPAAGAICHPAGMAASHRPDR